MVAGSNSNSEKPTGPDSSLVALWVDYAKERYLATEAQNSEFRSWARQLGAAMSIIMGLELTVLNNLLFESKLKLSIWHALAPCLLLLAVLIGFLMLFGSIRAGYAAEPLPGPESPSRLRPILSDWAKQSPNPEELFASYYANGQAEGHKLQQRLAAKLHCASKRLIASLMLFLLGILAAVADLGHNQLTTISAPSVSTTPALPSSHANIKMGASHAQILPARARSDKPTQMPPLGNQLPTPHRQP